MTNLANAWVRRGWQVTLVTLSSADSAPCYVLDPTVDWRPLGLLSASAHPLQAMFMAFKRIRALRHAIRQSKPHAVVSFLDATNVLVLLACVGTGIPVIVSERIDPARMPLSRPWGALRTLSYRAAALIIVQTRMPLPRWLSALRSRIRVIPNPVGACTCDEPARPTSDGGYGPDQCTLMAMGRLTEQKGFDLLLRAFAGVAPRHPTWILTIWGEGPLRASLEELRDRLGLHARVSLPGLTGEPNKRFREADLFVLTSRFEGFPNALCEAMACGLPVISFDCRSGPRDIVRHGVDGILVPPENVNALCMALDSLMGDPGLRAQLAMRAPEVVERFSLDSILVRWDAVLDEVA